MNGDPAISGGDRIPSPETIRQTAREVLARPEFRHDEAEATDVTFFKHILEFIVDCLSPISHFFAALYAVSPVLYVLVVIGLVVVLIAVVVHIVYSFAVAMKGRARPTEIATTDDLPPDTPEDWESRAEAAAATNNYILALRYFFRAGLLRLETARGRKLRRAATNREYIRIFRDSPARDGLAVLVHLIDYKWYGGGDCSRDDFDDGTEAYRSICRAARRIAHVHGP